MKIARIVVWFATAVVVARLWISDGEQGLPVKTLQTLVAVTVGYMLTAVTFITVKK